ncbi:putative small secreted protein [Pullulanibacillus pueri]|uniref:PepSY domain-containing protein n=1 Tax=Pullulanibacillus pueri TaxID=1437324 RepID=A0A8J2ZZR2_9BACL|nr:hypothetical protein [Pullulanibacillus pueri]MBM7683982.1 putative small secreted protein [Pullulanibacillus pueri]GGH88150.1 hypothetical protein GCM10007096_39830 [Pullulanibacillus pueri]
MNKKIMIITAVSAGFIGGFLVKKGLERQALSPEKVLSKVKAAAKETIDIDGAWIFLEKEPWMNGKILYDVFKGGLTEVVDDEVTHYDFIADAGTGTLLQLKEN